MADAPANKPFRISGTHDGANTTTYELLQDGTSIMTHPVADLVGGEITFDLLNGVAPGSYEFVIQAIGAFERSSSDPLTAVVVPPPARVADVKVTILSP